MTQHQACSEGGARSADAQWIREAVDQFESPLTSYAARLLGGDVERARDLVQDAFLKLWTADRAAVNGRLAPWLYRVCRNAALDVRRKEVRMTTMQDMSRIEAAGTSTQAVQGDSNREQMRGVMAALESLNERQQEVVRLKFQGNLSYREIAEVMDLTVNHVGVLLHNALKAIRERVGTAEAPRGEVMT